MSKPVVLMILDGWGINPDCINNAACQAKTPALDHLFATCSHAQLLCSGEAVGLPDGQQGNSEVGHLNLGAGRVVYQDLLRINRDIQDGSFEDNPAFKKMMTRLKAEGKALHLLGLLSDGGVHSHQDHLYALLDMAKNCGLEKVFVHAFMDGRDVSPTSGVGYLQALLDKMQALGVGQLATVSGRYYAMDRDKRWDREEKAWQAIVNGQGEQVNDVLAAMQASYDRDVTDEFIVPMVAADVDGRISEGDGVIFINFRADRAKQLTRTLVDPEFDGFNRGDFKPVDFISMTEYEADLDGLLTVAYPPLVLKNTLGEWLAAHGKTQLRTAETEKYAHVTSFFNGGVEAPNKNEDRVLIPSPKVATYDLQPEMSAKEVADTVVKGVESGKYDFILVNFANPDMVGHTGILAAAIQAMEAVDVAVGRVVEAVDAAGGKLLICADHGNCEKMANADGSPFTSHTTNPVPVILFGDGRTLHSGRLSDVAPTVLALMDCDKPAEMTGDSLLDQ
ncbi:MAG: 2,3-bisphosphoglycerate-independent phosphoglycerate mutase [Peptococcaceae bacterium]|nr:2,3-bisphosphoglycerate-independent phosphoglycerate mutase [Peptococcaceae bacterium]